LRHKEYPMRHADFYRRKAEIKSGEFDDQDAAA
jgi:hypothetical protein